MAKRYFDAQIMRDMMKASRHYTKDDLKRSYEELLNQYVDIIDGVEKKYSKLMVEYLDNISKQFNEKQLNEVGKQIPKKNKKLYDKLLQDMKDELINVEEKMLEKVDELEKTSIINSIEDILSSNEFNQELIINLLESNKTYKRTVNKYVNDLYKSFVKDNKQHMKFIKSEIIKSYNIAYKELITRIGNVNKTLFFNHKKELQKIGDRLMEAKQVVERDGYQKYFNHNMKKLNLKKLYLTIPYENKNILDAVINLFNFLLYTQDNGCQKQIKNKNEYAKTQNIACTDKRINSYFDNIMSIGIKSANGIVFKLNIREVGDDSTFVIKTNVNDFTDPLEYEYDIQSSLNELRTKIPNFSLAFGLFKCEPTTGVLQIRTLKQQLGKRLAPVYKNNIENQLKRRFSSVNSVCKVSENKRNNFIFTITEFVDNPLTLSEFALEKATNADDVIDILLQTTCALQIAQEEKDFTHYDLHSGNVLIKPMSDIDSKLDKNAVPIFGYKFNDVDIGSNTPYFFCRAKYLAIIIDFGRSYVKDKKLFYNPVKRKPNDSDWSPKYGITPNRFNRYWDIARLWSVTIADAIDNPNIKNKDKLNIIFNILDEYFGCGNTFYLGDLSNRQPPINLLDFLISISILEYTLDDDDDSEPSTLGKTPNYSLSLDYESDDSQPNFFLPPGLDVYDDDIEDFDEVKSEMKSSNKNRRSQKLIKNPINLRRKLENQPVYLFNDKEQDKYDGDLKNINMYMSNLIDAFDTNDTKFKDNIKFNNFFKRKVQVGGRKNKIHVDKKLINKNKKKLNKNKERSFVEIKKM
jgi:hypothetical protein